MKEIIRKIRETPQSRAEDIELYEIALSEYESDNKSSGIWAKALALSGGNKEVAESKYLELRVETLRDEKVLEKNEFTKNYIDFYEQENDTFLREEIDKASGTVGRIMGIYLLIGILLVVLSILTLILDVFTEEMILVAGAGIVALAPYLIVKYILSNKVENLRGVKRRLNRIYLITIFCSLFLYILGWICALILVFRVVRLNKVFKYDFNIKTH